MKIFLILVFVTATFASVLREDSPFNHLDYSRDLVEQQYPGFGKTWLYFYDENENLIREDIGDKTRILFNLYNVSNDVFFTLYTRQNPQGVNITDVFDVSSLSATTFDVKKPIQFMTHGFRSIGSSETAQSIKNGFLEKYDANVFVVDWSEISKKHLYVICAEATKDVGAYVAQFIDNLIELGADRRQFHLVGHSLGAHISGMAGRNIKGGKLDRITGLDPALPGFDNIIFRDGISANDAEFVDIIHTCGGFLGTPSEVGHADFFPNGGTPAQPGCNLILEAIEACSHGRSWKYFAESLTSPKPFYALKCKDYHEFLNGVNCQDETMMGDPLPKTARGKYFLKTGSASPFALGQI